LRRPLVSAGYSGLKADPGSDLFVGCPEPKTHESSRSLGRLLGQPAVSAIIGRIERMGSLTKEAPLLASLNGEIKATKKILIR
jgi:hypothetical protein